MIKEAKLRFGGCQRCEEHARQMDEWGVDECRRRVPEIAGWLRESWQDLPWRDQLAAAKAFAGKLDWLRPVESLVDLAVAEAERKTLSVFVLGHERKQLDQVARARHLSKVNLAGIETDNRLAESRAFLPGGPFDQPPETAFIGLATANWNRKYGPTEIWYGRKWPHCLPLERLDELDLDDPKVVWHAALTDDEHWGDEGTGLDGLFPGCAAIVDELVARFGLRGKHAFGPLANNFIAHRDVTLAHARFMRAAIEFLDSRYGPVWPVSGEVLPCFADRLAAFACECASILYFANRPDLELRQIPPPG